MGELGIQMPCIAPTPSTHPLGSSFTWANWAYRCPVLPQLLPLIPWAAASHGRIGHTDALYCPNSFHSSLGQQLHMGELGIQMPCIAPTPSTHPLGSSFTRANWAYRCPVFPQLLPLIPWAAASHGRIGHT